VCCGLQWNLDPMFEIRVCWYNNSLWTITGGQLVTPAWGQLIRFMVGRTRSTFALPCVGAEALIIFMMEFQYTASVRLWLPPLDSKRLTEWSVTVDLSLKTPDRISWKREIRGWQYGQIFNILSFPSISIIQKENTRAWSGEQGNHRGPKSSCRNQGSERCWSRFLINRLKGGGGD
jgi:hypothetical protein